MLTIFTVIFVIATVFVICTKIEEKTSIYIESFAFVLIFLVSFLFSIFLGMLLESTIYNASNKTQIINTVDEMIAMSDSTAMRRTYIRTYGTEESYVYRYVVKSKFGKQVKELKNSRNIHIVESNNRVPAIVKYNYKLDNGFLSFLVSESIFDKEGRTEVVVPEGTISEGYEIDLE